MKRIYLDYAATTPVRPEVIEAALPYLKEDWGNPSSIHSHGQDARAAVDVARQQVAALIGAKDPSEIYFTSGGTEADNWALKGVAFANREHGNHIITSSIEHHAIIETGRFLEKQGLIITYLPVDSKGLINPDDVKKAITPKTILISVMHANNEVGTIQPIAEIGKITRKAGVYLHTDAVQTVGHIPVNVGELGVDMLSVSAHKLYGPKGIGVLYIRRGVKIEPLIHGGAQENSQRAGTENVPGIVGFGKAAALAAGELPEEARRLTGLRDDLIHNILTKIEHTKLNGHPTQRLPNNVNISFEFVEGEPICLNLDLAGISVATGSACSSESAEASHVLLAMGLTPAQARGSIRFTFGKWSSEADVNKVMEVLPKTIERLRAISPLSMSKK